MQVKNNYDILWREDGGAASGMGVFNGDIGRIQSIDPRGECITVDFDTVGDPEKGIEADNCVTIRDRDTMEQVRVPIDQLVNFINEKIDF